MLPSENMPKTKRSDPLIGFEKQALKTKSYVFSRTRSMKLERQTKKTSFQINHNQFDEKLFVPKLKSKQLLREPKFFFSLQRKKIKNEHSEPTFDQPKTQNPEMKGSKAKALYTKMMMTRKDSIQECLRAENSINSRKRSLQQIQSTSESRCEKASQIFVNEKIQGKLLLQNWFPSQSTLDAKTLKRPNLYENLSFLIRRKRESKNRNTMKKINQARHYMTQEITQTELPTP